MPPEAELRKLRDQRSSPPCGDRTMTTQPAWRRLLLLLPHRGRTGGFQTTCINPTPAKGWNPWGTTEYEKVPTLYGYGHSVDGIQNLEAAPTANSDLESLPIWAEDDFTDEVAPTSTNYRFPFFVTRIVEVAKTIHVPRCIPRAKQCPSPRSQNHCDEDIVTSLNSRARPRQKSQRNHLGVARTPSFFLMMMCLVCSAIGVSGISHGRIVQEPYAQATKNNRGPSDIGNNHGRPHPSTAAASTAPSGMASVSMFGENNKGGDAFDPRRHKGVVLREEDLTLGEFVPSGNDVVLQPGGGHEEEDDTLRREHFLEIREHSVRLQDFEAMLRRAHSYHDVIRIFYKEQLSDAEIDAILARRHEPRVSATDTVWSGRGQNAELADNANGHRNLNEEMAAAWQNYYEVDRVGKCEPKTTLVPVRTKVKVASMIYQPTCALVHRCQTDSGCCPPSMECAMKSMHLVKLPFLAFELQKVGTVGLGPGQLAEFLEFENHTACECREIATIPKCAPCPLPFALWGANFTECICDCRDGDKTCRRIKRGIRPLEEKQLECIKSGMCHRPECQYGEFDDHSLRSGFCPPKLRPDDFISNLSGASGNSASGGSASGPVPPTRSRGRKNG